MRTTEDVQQDLKGIQDPGSWPMWPALPIKRYVKKGGFPEHAFLLDNAPLSESKTRFPVKIYFGNMWRLSETGYLENLKTIEYASAQAIIDDGWEVD